MAEKVISDDISVGGTPARPGVPAQRSVTETLFAPATVETVAGGRYPWVANIPRALPFSFDDLTSDFGDDIYQKMLLDPQVSACLNTLKTAILSDGVSITSAILDATAPGFKRAQTIADFVRHDLENLEPTLDSVLWALLDAMAYGAKVAEQVYRLEGGQLHLAALKVKPRRVTAFVVDAYMNVLGLLAVIPGVATSASLSTMLITDPASLPNMLPRDKFAVYTHWPRDADPRGTSILRPAYRPWWDKQQMVPEYLKYLTQFASPSMVATAPEANTPYTTTDVDGTTVQQSVAQQIARALEGFRNGTFVVLPFGATARPVEVAGDGIPFMHAFDRFDRQISTAILHQTLATQESRHETRAAAEVHQDILALLIRMSKRALAQMLRNDVFKPLVRYNWGDDAANRFTPTVNLSEIEAEDLSPRMQAVAQMAQNGLIFPSQLPDLFADLDLPEASQEDLARYAEQFAAPPPQAAPTPPPTAAGTPVMPRTTDTTPPVAPAQDTTPSQEEAMA
jgi:hypothetical protein